MRSAGLLSAWHYIRTPSPVFFVVLHDLCNFYMAVCNAMFSYVTLGVFFGDIWTLSCSSLFFSSPRYGFFGWSFFVVSTQASFSG
jgi:hypothetical protein